jgi:glycosyltransferase involved in cell wall biosynthesis
MNTPAGFRHQLETPHPFQPARGYFRLEGWALFPGASGRTRLRLRINDELFTPDTLIERPDVAGAFPGDPHALYSGFRFLCFLRFGLYAGTLEASVDDTVWQPVRTLSIPVSSHPLLGAIEKPAPGTFIDRAVRVEGWCFHPEFEITSVVLRLGNIEVACDYPIPRDDVTALFPQHPAARCAGFITSENLPKGSGPIKIRAETSCGRVYFLESTLRADIRDSTDHVGSPLSAVKRPFTLPVMPLAEKAALGERPRIPAPGARNILFVLYGDFTCNSALHVAALANALIDLGYDCVVAGPSHKETIVALPRAKFMALEFAEWETLPELFVDRLGPTLVHAWTPRENVRKFTEQVRRAYDIPVIVHLEDNEAAILESRLGYSAEELARLSPQELDARVPEHLSHPQRSQEFLAAAAGITTIVDKLVSTTPPGVPTLTFWPAADPHIYFPREPDPSLRAALGIGGTDTVLLYHGNVHAANAAEVGSLYEAVAHLNSAGHRTFLIRAGRDDEGLMTQPNSSIRPYLIHLGYVAPRFLAELMRLADYFVQPGVPGTFNDFRFPSKLPEFFAIGRPVILPRSNLGTALRHGEDAFVLPEATAETIAAAVLTLHRDRELTARLSAGALAFSARYFSWTRTAEQLLEFYLAHTRLAPVISGSGERAAGAESVPVT